MGACTFYIIAEGETMRDAYAQAVEDFEYEYGHSSNGTISTTTGFIDLTSSAPDPKDQKAFEEFYEEHIQSERVCRKYGPAIGVKDSRKSNRFIFFGWAAE